VGDKWVVRPGIGVGGRAHAPVSCGACSCDHTSLACRYYKPLQLALVVKEKNGGKLNSHLWFFSAFVKQLQPDYCVVRATSKWGGAWAVRAACACLRAYMGAWGVVGVGWGWRSWAPVGDPSTLLTFACATPPPGPTNPPSPHTNRSPPNHPSSFWMSGRRLCPGPSSSCTTPCNATPK
jgi:hypothetical protein